ncbi:MAG: hypothetical protein K2N96_08545 [Muribaculaceae bacterium]|nr:hypothetical protein [Muribaculaceae bacterium]
MAFLYSTEVQAGIVYSPVDMTSGIAVVGTVAPIQQFDIASGIYTPDYATGTPVTLQPWLEIKDPDGILPGGKVEIANPQWKVIEDGVVKTASNLTQYDATTGSGVTAGRLLVKRNIDPEKPLTMLFHGEWADPRTGEVHEIQLSQLLTCEAVSAPLKLVLDMPQMIRYDPIRDTVTKRKIKAQLFTGIQEITGVNRAFIWQKRDKGGDWHNISATEIMDYDVSVNAAGDELTIDCSLMGERIDIRCFGLYNPYGAASGIAITDKTPCEQFAAIRTVPRLRAVELCHRQLKKNVRKVYPELRIYDSKGEIPNPDTVCEIRWKRSTGNASGTVTKSAVVAYGSKPTLSTDNLAVSYGGKFIAEYGPKEPLRALKTADGKILTTADGKVLVG